MSPSEDLALALQDILLVIGGCLEAQLQFDAKVTVQLAKLSASDPELQPGSSEIVARFKHAAEQMERFSERAAKFLDVVERAALGLRS